MKKILVAALLLAALSFCPLSLDAAPGTGGGAPASGGSVTILKSFSFPGGWSYVRDAAWDGSSLWVGENLNSSLYQIDPNTGAILSSFFGPDSNPWGLAWDGVNLKSATITMYHLPPGDTLPDWVYTVAVTGSILYKWLAPNSPDATPHGLAYDPALDSLWSSDAYTATIFELDPLDGTIRSSFAFPAADPRGLAWDGVYIWGIDNPTQTLYAMDTAGKVIDGVSISLLGSDPEGLTWDGVNFWVTENQTDKIYQIALLLDPRVDVKCNGRDAGVSVPSGANAKVDFAVRAGNGAGTPVDVWIVMKTPFGFFSYDGAGPYSGWNLGLGNVYATGPLADVTGTALDRPLPLGSYKAFIGIDTVPNGVLNLGNIYTMDFVDFTVP